MNDRNTTTGSGGPGVLLLAGVAVALAIVAGGYLILQPGAPPSEEQLTAVVPEVTSSELDPSPKEGAGPVSTTGAEQSAGAVTEPTTQESSDAVLSDAPVAQEADEVSSVVEAEKENLDRIPPTVDEVRVESDGVIVIAGRAEPGATVEILVDSEIAATAQADAQGAFAALGFLESMDQPRVLSLRSRQNDVLTVSAEDVILAPVTSPPVAVVQAQNTSIASQEAPDGEKRQEPEAQNTSSAESPEQETNVSTAESGDIAQATDRKGVAVVADNAPDPAGTITGTSNGTVADVSENTDSEARLSASDDTNSIVETDEVVETAGNESSAGSAEALAPSETGSGPQVEAPAKPEAAPDASAAPQIALLKSDAQGVTLLQTAPEPPARIQLDTIGYSDSGAVELAGRASTEAVEVRVYLNNRVAATLPVVGQGTWRGEVPEVDAGVYTLRVDEVDAEGVVTSRIETPFKREAPEALAAATASANGPASAVTVQTGDTLWAIARDRYGEGVLYVQVFEANRTAIRDPDLIYPGQIFALPPD